MANRRYKVWVRFTEQRTQDIDVWAGDEEAAIDKACAIVERWDDVTEAEADDVEVISEDD